ncbi:MAG: DNA replication and repair protein RecF [Paracoccaceae bacterium]|jgi:DNA replication and repair protein RecF
MTRRAVLRLGLTLFRSHARLRLETDGRPVALFGANGAGKTNILEALSLLSPGRGLRRASAEEMARAPSPIGWKIAAQIRTPDALHDVETSVDLARGASRAVLIDGKSAPQTRLGMLAPLLWLTPAMDRLWTEGAGERRRFIDRIALAFEPGHADNALSYEKAMRDRNRLLKDDIRDPGWHGALEDRMAESGAALAAARARTVARLIAAQHGAATAFPTADLTLEGAPEDALSAALALGADMDAAQSTAAESLRRAFRDGRGRDAAAGRTLVGPHRTDLRAIYAAKGVEAKLCSTGEQKALLISLMLAAGRAMTAQDGDPPVILLDEVAAHLDADRRAALYDEVSALGAQAWMTGTGAELFEALGPRAHRIEVREGEAGSTLTDR